VISAGRWVSGNKRNDGFMKGRWLLVADEERLVGDKQRLKSWLVGGGLSKRGSYF